MQPEIVTVTSTNPKSGVVVLKNKEEGRWADTTIIYKYKNEFKHVAGMWFPEGSEFDFFLTVKGQLEREREANRQAYEDLKKKYEELLLEVEGLKKPKKKKGWGTQPPIKAAVKSKVIDISPVLAEALAKDDPFVSIKDSLPHDKNN